MKNDKLALDLRPWPVRASSFRPVLILISFIGLLLCAPRIAAASPPVISGFSPDSGSVGSQVTITGEALAGATEVRFNGLLASFHSGFGGTDLIAIVPADAETGPITVVTPDGIVSTSNDFTVTTNLPPVINTFTPTSGQVGSTVTITGQNLDGTTSVTLNGLTASFTLFGNTIAVVVPQGASSGAIKVVTPFGSAQTQTAFTVLIPGAPVITTVSPNRGGPGTGVLIGGQDLATASAVWFNGAPATFQVFGNSLFATVPNDAPSGPITVATPKGTASSPTDFTVVGPLSPAITGFSPPAGPEGTSLTISGTNFVGAAEVRIGSAAATFVVSSGTEIKATVPVGATSGTIKVTTPQGTAESDDHFDVTAKVTSFDPAFGQVGASVTIHGTNFTDVIAVLFAGVSASFTTVSSEEIVAVVPDGATTGTISVATPAGFGDSTALFYLPPKIVKFDPASGDAGTDVSVTGENLSGATKVQVGGVDATFSAISGSALSLEVPVAFKDGPITVTTPAGTAVSADRFYNGAFSDVTVRVATTPDTITTNGFLSYIVTVANHGPLDATGVVLTDRLPPSATLVFSPSGAPCAEANHIITCNLGTVANGAEVAIKISTTTADFPYLTNQVSAAVTSADPNPDNNSVQTVTILDGAPPLPTGDVSLSVSLNGTAAVFSWPAAAGAFRLESTTGLGAAAVWTPEGSSPVQNNGINSVQVTVGQGTRFFRLKNL